MIGFAINPAIYIITIIIHAQHHLPSVHRGHEHLGIPWTLVLPALPSDPDVKYMHTIICNINNETSYLWFQFMHTSRIWFQCHH